MTMTTRIIVSIAAAAALVAAVHAQEAPPLKLTPETLAQAIADGESQQPCGLPLVPTRLLEAPQNQIAFQVGHDRCEVNPFIGDADVR